MTWATSVRTTALAVPEAQVATAVIIATAVANAWGPAAKAAQAWVAPAALVKARAWAHLRADLSHDAGARLCAVRPTPGPVPGVFLWQQAWTHYSHERAADAPSRGHLRTTFCAPSWANPHAPG